MKKSSKILTGVVVGAVLMTSIAFAAPEATSTATETKQPAKKHQQFFVKQDPTKKLENMKAMIEKKLADGKITQEKADTYTAKLDAAIKQLQDFNNLSLDQKKSTILSKVKANMDKKVQAGKLTQDKADAALAKITEKVNKWEGNGYPNIMSFVPKMNVNRQPLFIKKDPVQALEKMKAAINKRVADGKVTQDKADANIAKIDAKIKEIQDFNNLPLDQKKSTLISKAKTALDKRVQNQKITQEQADKALAAITEKINAWDGTGYPKSLAQSVQNFRQHHQKKAAQVQDNGVATANPAPEQVQ